MQIDATAVGRQINILTGALSIATVIITGGFAYLRLWQGSAITKAVTTSQEKIEAQMSASQEKIEAKITEATRELKQELARKDLVDAKFSELERRLTKTETWREAGTLAAPKLHES